MIVSGSAALSARPGHGHAPAAKRRGPSQWKDHTRLANAARAARTTAARAPDTDGGRQCVSGEVLHCSGLQEAETQLLQDLREGVEQLLQQQEQLVARFTQRCLRESRRADAPGGAEGAAGAAQDEGPPADPWPRSSVASAASAMASERSPGCGRQSAWLMAPLHTDPAFRDSTVPGGPADGGGGAAGPVMKALSGLYRWLPALEEPERTGRIAACVNSRMFEATTFLLILFNGALLVYQTDRNAQSALRNPAQLSELDSSWDTILEHCFSAYFIVELLLKLYVHGFYFFYTKDWTWNALDFLIVVATIFDIAGNIAGAAAGGEGVDANFMRILRVFRMARALRIVRALKCVQELRHLMECMVSSLWGVFWCMVLLFFIIGVFATFLVQIATAFWIRSEGVQPEDPEEERDLARLATSFGTIRHAMISLLRATSGGDDWGYYYNLMLYTGTMGPAIFVGYILFFIVAAWNIVTSLFLERALEFAQPDMEKLIREKRQQDEADAADLLGFAQAMDSDQSGTVSLQEFQCCMAQRELQCFLEMRGIDVKDALAFFRMLQEASGQEELELPALVNSLMRLRGPAASTEVQLLQHSLRTTLQASARALEDAAGLRAELRAALAALRAARAVEPAAPAKDPDADSKTAARLIQLDIDGFLSHSALALPETLNFRLV